VLWTIPSVYIATAIVGLIMGLLDGVARGGDMIIEDFVAALYGISVPSPFWLLYPLALITHLWVRAGENAAASGV